mgnify:CR=1 FL=1
MTMAGLSLMFAVVLFHNAGIDQKTDGADEHRDGKDDDGQPVIPKAHGVAAHGGGDHRGDPGNGGQHQKGFQLHGR